MISFTLTASSPGHANGLCLGGLSAPTKTRFVCTFRGVLSNKRSQRACTLELFDRKDAYGKPSPEVSSPLPLTIATAIPHKLSDQPNLYTNQPKQNSTFWSRSLKACFTSPSLPWLSWPQAPLQRLLSMRLPSSRT